MFLKDLAKPDEPPVPLTDAGEEYSDLAWAPTLDVNLVAMFRDKSPGKDHTDQDLCLLQVTKSAQPPQCIPDPDINLDKTVRWAPDGKSIFALGVKAPTARSASCATRPRRRSRPTPRTGARASSSPTPRSRARA